MMINFIQRFRRSESGAVTVDWVVLTAAVVGLAVSTYLQLEANTNVLANATADRIAAEPDPRLD